MIRLSGVGEAPALEGHDEIVALQLLQQCRDNEGRQDADSAGHAHQRDHRAPAVDTALRLEHAAQERRAKDVFNRVAKRQASGGCPAVAGQSTHGQVANDAGANQQRPFVRARPEQGG